LQGTTFHAVDLLHLLENLLALMLKRVHALRMPSR
jgi:hypothetical protein